MRGHAAFVSRIQGVNLLNIERAPGFDRLFKKWSAVWTYVIDPYFQAVADLLLERLSADTARRLSLVEAAGFASVDLTPSRPGPSAFTSSPGPCRALPALDVGRSSVRPNSS
jgi:hypothetical protein